MVSCSLLNGLCRDSEHSLLYSSFNLSAKPQGFLQLVVHTKLSPFTDKDLGASRPCQEEDRQSSGLECQFYLIPSDKIQIWGFSLIMVLLTFMDIFSYQESNKVRVTSLLSNKQTLWYLLKSQEMKQGELGGSHTMQSRHSFSEDEDFELTSQKRDFSVTWSISFRSVMLFPQRAGVFRSWWKDLVGEWIFLP